MKDFKLFSYIRKCWMLIVLSSLVMGMLFYSYFSGKQTYTASAIIQYRNIFKPHSLLSAVISTV